MTEWEGGKNKGGRDKAGYSTYRHPPDNNDHDGEEHGWKACQADEPVPLDVEHNVKHEEIRDAGQNQATA